MTKAKEKREREREREEQTLLLDDWWKMTRDLEWWRHPLHTKPKSQRKRTVTKARKSEREKEKITAIKPGSYVHFYGVYVYLKGAVCNWWMQYVRYQVPTPSIYVLPRLGRNDVPKTRTYGGLRTPFSYNSFVLTTQSDRFSSKTRRHVQDVYIFN